MGIARERVVPVPPKPAWLCYGGLAFALGLMVGAIRAGVMRWSFEHVVVSGGPFSISGSGLRVYAFIGIGMLVVGFAPIAVLLRVTQRWSVAMTFAVVYAASMDIAGDLAGVLARGDGGANTKDWIDLHDIASVGKTVLFFIVGASLMLALCRWLIVRTVEHHSGNCRWCGYTLGSDAIVRCPECGRDRNTTPYRARRLVMGIGWLAARWKVAILTCAILVLLCAIRPVWMRTIPSARFFASFPGALKLGEFQAAVRGLSVPRGVPRVWVASQRQIDRGLLVTFIPDSPAVVSPMSVEIAGTPRDDFPAGASRVFADLDRRQSEFVVAHGLPDGLVRALYAKADDVAWMPESASRGQWEVDPGPYFPK